VSENEAVCNEVQTHFGSSLLASFAEKVLGAYSRFMRPKTKLFVVEFRRILEVFPCKLHKKDMGAFSRFLRAKTELFAVKLRRILEVFALRGL